MRNPTWTRDELNVTLDFYLRSHMAALGTVEGEFPMGRGKQE